MGNLWGPSKELDYWTARRADHIAPEERRAMALLASITDERRFSLYCMTGHMPAMGNVTKRMYLVRRFDRVLELEDGRPYQSWCIGAPDRSAIPETDHIVTMKNIIEGEELAFRDTGNMSPVYGGVPHEEDSIRNPYTVSFLRGAAEGRENADFVDFMDVKKERDRMMDLYTFKKKMWDEVINEGPPALEDLLSPSVRKRDSAKIGIGGGFFGVQQMAGPPRQFVLMDTATNASTVPTIQAYGNAGTITNGIAVQNCQFGGNGIQLGGV